MSTRQRPYVFREQAAFGGFEERRPHWGELGPILLRSAGIVGAAGVIMAIVGGGAFFTGTERAPRVQPDTPVILHQETAASEELPAAEAASTQSAAAAALLLAEAAPPTGRFSDVEPLASYVPPATETEPAAPRLASRADVDAARAQPAPAPLQLLDPARFDAVSPDPPAEPEGPQIWEEEAVACPRDWVQDADADAAGGRSASCETEAALAAADPASPDLEEALSEAASEEAVEIVGFVARVPLPRPDPPPPTPVVSRSSQPDSWPSEPPPDCGSQHAYWRYTDRKRGIKEWYCR